ncbi:MAG: VOC family protein [Microbacterium sp.]
MSEQTPAPHNFKQIAYVVKDAYRAMDEWGRLAGVGPWSVRRLNNRTLEDFEIDGVRITEEFEYICGVAWAGNVELEIIEPVRGPNIFWDFLERHGEGLHHIKNVMPTSELPAELARYAGLGCAVLESGRVEDDLHYFLDTERLLGFILELGNQTKLTPAPEIYQTTRD